MESTNVSDEVLNLMPGAVALFRADESIFCANEAMQDLYDCQSQREFFELTGASFRGMVLPEHYESIAMMVEKAMQHGSALQGGACRSVTRIFPSASARRRAGSARSRVRYAVSATAAYGSGRSCSSMSTRAFSRWSAMP